MSLIIVDTNVIVDMFLEDRSRHSAAMELKKYLDSNDVRIRIPMHAYFEIGAAIQNEALISSPSLLRPSSDITIDAPLRVDPIPIDMEFMKKYFHIKLPYIKAGDLIFLAMAKGEDAMLITEDDEQYEKAKAAGIKTYRISEFLREFSPQN